jgi:YHS domain-containing protein
MTATSNEHDFVDPVCEMKVAKGSKVPFFVLRSETYYFCSDSCRKAFMDNPQQYMKSGSKKRKGLWSRYLDRLNKATQGKPPCCH